MRKHFAAVLIALSVVGSSLVFAVVIDAGGTENGGFPDREFILTKGKGGKTSLSADISPSTDCTWWVELATLGGSGVKVDVYEHSNESSKELSHSRLTQVGDESKHVRLTRGTTYRATLQYEGRPGISILNERISTGPIGNAHEPILITSNSEFTAANGVISGSGTIGDPYVIGGWSISATTGSCVEIRDTNAYFVINGVTLAAADYEFGGFVLSNVSNGAVLGSVVTECWYGIHMDHSTNIRLVGCDFSNDIIEVRMEYCSDIEIRDSLFMAQSEGLGIQDSSNFVVSNCTITAVYNVFWISSCSKGLIKDNLMTLLDQRGIGLYLLESSSMTLYSNNFVNTSIDIVDFGMQGVKTHTIAPNNTVNGKPILFFKGQTGLVLDAVNAGEIILVQCQNVMVSNMEFSRNYACVIVEYSTHVTVRNNTFSLSYIGVRVEFSSDIQILGNSMSQMTVQAIGVWDTPNTVIDGNSMSSLGTVGYQTLMPIFRTPFLEITNNTFSDSYDALLVFSVGNAIVVGNTISRMSHEAMRIDVSSDLTIKENTLTDNGIGASVESSARVMIYHNNFQGNTVQAKDSANTDTYWDDGYPAGGNFWSDYHGKDANGDGIGDTPYSISTSVSDRYPLIGPWIPSPPAPEYTQHAPIHIAGDAGFTPANGVRSGSGTSSDPYVIEGWDINASAATGLEIIGTTAHYVLRHLRVHSGTAIQPYLHEGIRLENAPNGRVENIEAYDNTIELDIRSSSNLVIANNTFTNHFSGAVYLLTCGSIEFYNNAFVAGGIVVQYTSYVTAKGNSFNQDGFCFWGSSQSDFNTHLITSDNTVAGKPVIYIANGQDIDLHGVIAAQVIVASSKRVTLSGLNFSNVGQGVVLAYVTDSVVQSCTFTSHADNCVKLYYCSNVTLVGNVLSDTHYYALETISSSRVTIRDNIVERCSYGIVIRYYSPETLIENNTAYGNYAAILLYNAYGGIRLIDNNLSSNDIGILMSGAKGSEVVGNRIAMNAQQGILLESGSSSNKFYHNSMISNTAQVVGETAGANSWDNGYPSGGNYWGDYVGVDLFSGPNQDQIGSDGIGDVQYVVGLGSIDRYPLML